MSHFYAEIEGKLEQKEVTGSKQSDIDGHVKGQNIGICVKCYFDEEKQKDVCEVFKTPGSNTFTGRFEHLATVEEE